LDVLPLALSSPKQAVLPITAAPNAWFLILQNHHNDDWKWGHVMNVTTA